MFNTVNLQLYHYAGNNPIKYIDPDGREVTYRVDPATSTYVENNKEGASGFSFSGQFSVYGYKMNISGEFREFRNENPKDGTKNAVMLSYTYSLGESDVAINANQDGYLFYQWMAADEKLISALIYYLVMLMSLNNYEVQA